MAASNAEAPTTSNAGRINIKVKTLGQASYDLEVAEDALVSEVKAQLAQASSTPANLQRLVFRGRVLKDEQRLSQYSVGAGAVIHLVTRPVDVTQPPPPASPVGGSTDRWSMHGTGGGPFHNGMPAGMEMSDIGSIIASLLSGMGIQGAVRIETAGPEAFAGTRGGSMHAHQDIAQAMQQQMAAAVQQAQHAQQAQQQQQPQQQQGPHPRPAQAAQLPHLFTSLQRYLATLNGNLAAVPLALPSRTHPHRPPPFTVQQYTAAVRELMTNWRGGSQAAQDTIASSASPEFGLWQPSEGAEGATAAPTPQQQATAPTAAAAAAPISAPGAAGVASAAAPEQPPVETAPSAPVPIPAEPSRTVSSIPSSGSLPTVHSADAGSTPASTTPEARDSSEGEPGGGLAPSQSMASLQSLASPQAPGAHLRDPRRNGMDNPFGEERPDPLHPDLALLSGYAALYTLQETAQHLQSRALPALAGRLNRLQSALDLPRAVLDRNPATLAELQTQALGAAAVLHAESALLAEAARAESAFALALRDDSAAPLLGALPLHVAPDGSRPAAPGPAGVGGRAALPRNAIFINGGAGGGGVPVGPGRAGLGRGGRGTRRGGGGPRAGGPAPGRGGRGGGGGSGGDAHAHRQQQQQPGVFMPMQGGIPLHALGALMNGASIPIAGSVIRIIHDQNQDPQSLTMQVGDTPPVTLDLSPLISAYNAVFARVPGLLGGNAAAGATPAAPPGQPGAAPASSAPDVPTAPAPGASGAPAAGGGAAAAGATAQQAMPTQEQRWSAFLSPILQQTIPMLVGMLASGRPVQGAGAPGQAPGQAAPPGGAAQGQHQQQQQQQQQPQGHQHFLHQWQQLQHQASYGPGQSHASFSLPPFMTGMGANQVQVDIQTSVLGGGPGAAGGGMSADVVGPLVQGLLFAMGQGGGGFPAAPPDAAAAASFSAAQGGRGRGRGGGRGTRANVPPSAPVLPSATPPATSAPAPVGGQPSGAAAEGAAAAHNDPEDEPPPLLDDDSDLPLSDSDADDLDGEDENDGYDEDEEEDDGDDVDDAFSGASDASGMDSGDDDDGSEGWRTADEDVGEIPGEDADGAGSYPVRRGAGQERHVSSRPEARDPQQEAAAAPKEKSAASEPAPPAAQPVPAAPVPAQPIPAAPVPAAPPPGAAAAGVPGTRAVPASQGAGPRSWPLSGVNFDALTPPASPPTAPLLDAPPCLGVPLPHQPQQAQQQQQQQRSAQPRLPPRRPPQGLGPGLPGLGAGGRAPRRPPPAQSSSARSSPAASAPPAASPQVMGASAGAQQQGSSVTAAPSSAAPLPPSLTDLFQSPGGSSSVPAAQPPASSGPPASSWESNAGDPTRDAGDGVEEVQRSAPAAAAQPLPDLGALFSGLLGGNASGGGASASVGGGGGGLMGIMRSPAFQQMASQLLGPAPAPSAGAVPGSTTGALPQQEQREAGQQPGAHPGPTGSPVSSSGQLQSRGGGGLMDMMSQMARSPAMHQIAGQLMEPDEARGSNSARGGAGDGEPDFGALLQQMLPVVSQMLGGGGPPQGPAHSQAVATGRPGAAVQRSRSSDDLSALSVLSPDEAQRWRDIILADRVAQARAEAPALGLAYLASALRPP